MRFSANQTRQDCLQNDVMVIMATAVLVLKAAYLVSRDINTLRRQMQERVKALEGEACHILNTWTQR